MKNHLVTLSSIFLLLTLTTGCSKKDAAKPPVVIGRATVSLGNVSNITATSFTISGNVALEAGTPATSRGFCWSSTPMPTVSDNKAEAGNGAGIFNYNITELKQGTIYYVRAYTTNTEGTGYSNQQSISTNAIDSDGNIYHTIIIGTQLWMVENLKATHYRNGDAIPNVQDNTTWESTFTVTGAYCDYNNDVNTGKVYGHLYNYATINDPRNVCPEGWRLPKDNDWKALVNYLRGNEVAGGKMKEAGPAHWITPNTGATNSSGFTALPAGNRGYSGFYSIGEACYFWSDPSDIFSRSLFYDHNDIAGLSNTGSVLGLTIRCIRE